MANLYTGTETITNQSGLDNLVTLAYDKMVGFQLRSEPLFRDLIDKRPADVSHAGASVRLQKYQDLAVTDSLLVENVDPDAVALDNTTYIDIVLEEYGKSVLSTEKLALESLSAVDPAIANIVSQNMRDTLDKLVQDVFLGNDNTVDSVGGALVPTTDGSADAANVDGVIDSEMVRYTVSKLRGASAQTFGGKYLGYIHPDVSLDLRAETGAAAWRDVHNYSGASAIWAGEIGEYEGVRFVESPRLNQDSASGVKVSSTFILGQEAVAEACGREPGVVIGNVTDRLLRTRPIGWKTLIGWAIYREEALYQLRTTSSY